MTGSEYQQLVEFLGRQFETIDRRFETIDRRLDAIDRRLEAIDRRFDTVDQRFDAAAVEFAVFGRRMDALERRVEEGFRNVLGHLDGTYGRLERLEQEHGLAVQALRRIEARLADDPGRREILERSLADLKRQVTDLQSRIEELERHLG
jgi:chromosome segregation ATPase